MTSLKIAVVGTFHSGKTTICHKLVAKLKENNFNAELTREASRNSYYLANGKRGIKTQLDIFSRQLTSEIEYLRTNDILICDRSLVEVLAYTKLFAEENIDCTEQIIVKSIIDFVKEYIKTYDIVFYKTDTYDINLSTDPIRINDYNHQNDMLSRIESILKEYNVSCIPINNNSSIEMMYNQILSKLK